MRNLNPIYSDQIPIKEFKISLNKYEKVQNNNNNYSNKNRYPGVLKFIYDSS